MSANTLVDIIELYRIPLAKGGIAATPAPHNSHSLSRSERLSHALYMLDQALLASQKRQHKQAGELLRFAEGMLFALGVYTIDQILANNQ